MKQGFSLQTLLVDDDGNIRRTLSISLKDLGCLVDQAASVDEAVTRLKENHYDLILTDFRMQTQTGLDLIKKAKSLQPRAIIVIMTAYASYENAVAVVKEGAFDYLPKPFTTPQLAHLLSKVRELVSLRRENQELKTSQSRRDFFSGFTSPASIRLEDFIRKVAPTDGTVLLSGESGTGKSALAKLVHELSPRALKPFITVYCTTLTETLLESELFGHVRGSFTGATHDKPGKLELANGGTLFLDEIGDLTPNGQTKLLRFLQERVFERVGSNKVISVDTRILAATNRNLLEAAAAGQFREDLYYRLNVLECVIAPLRHRKEDLPILVERILKELTKAKNRQISLSQNVREFFQQYDWPGNVREVRNVLERAIMLAQSQEIQLSELPDSMLNWKATKTDNRRPLVSIEQLEKEHIEHVLAHSPSLEAAADTLGITTVTLWRKRKEYGLV